MHLSNVASRIGKVATALAVAVAVFAILPATAARAATMCGFKTGTSTVTKVMVIWMENHSYSSIVGSSSAPYLNNTVKAQCGLATNYNALTHPSLPNYLSATSGVSYATTPWTNDCSPTSCTTGNNNIYNQAAAAGKTWRGYAESMPSNCAKSGSGNYAPRHNPPPYYTDLTTCSTNDVPMGTTSSGNLLSAVNAGTLPNYSSVTPNLCNDMHDCSVSTGDTWLSGWVPKITAGPDFQNGRLAVFIVWDEGSGSGNATSHVACFVLSAFTPAGATSSTAFNHYSLLRTSEEVVGVSLLGNAGSATSMRSAFHI
jgi:hypothetical protein